MSDSDEAKPANHRLGFRRGQHEPSKFADVIAVEGNPLDDIAALGRVTFVMKAGQV